MSSSFRIWLVFVCLVAACVQGMAQSGAAPAAVTFTADQDQRNMMEQLGIKALRPGPTGNEKAANHANYDELKANPFAGSPTR